MNWGRRGETHKHSVLNNPQTYLPLEPLAREVHTPHVRVVFPEQESGLYPDLEASVDTPVEKSTPGRFSLTSLAVPVCLSLRSTHVAFCGLCTCRSPCRRDPAFPLVPVSACWKARPVFFL